MTIKMKTIHQQTGHFGNSLRQAKLLLYLRLILAEQVVDLQGSDPRKILLLVKISWINEEGMLKIRIQ